MKNVLLFKPFKKFNLNFYLKIFKEKKIEAYFRKFCSYYIIYSEKQKEITKLLGKNCMEGILWEIEELEDIANYISQIVGKRSFGIFAEKKSSPLSSTEIKKILGERVVKKSGALVNLDNPEVRVELIICGKKIFTHLSFSLPVHGEE